MIKKGFVKCQGCGTLYKEELQYGICQYCNKIIKKKVSDTGLAKPVANFVKNLGKSKKK